MTSNYDQYVRPEVWPLATKDIGYLFEGRNLPGDMCEIRAVGALSSERAGRVYIMGVVPREHVRGAIDTIIAYRDACRKLIG